MINNNAKHVITINSHGTNKHQIIEFNSDDKVVIGRSWQSDIVINDEYIDPEHLAVSIGCDGSLTVQDLDTKNGSRVGKVYIDKAMTYKPGTDILIGDSIVSLLDQSAAVAPALKRDTVQKLCRKNISFAWYFLSTLAALAALAITTFLLGTEEVNSELIGSNITELIMAAVLVSLIGGTLSKLFRQKAMFGLHYMFACWVFFLSSILTLAWNIIRFNIEPGITYDILSSVVYGVFSIFFVFGILSLITRTNRNRRLITAAAAVLLPTIYSLAEPMLESEHDKWNDYTLAASVDQPPAFHLTSSSSVDAHMQETDEIFMLLKKEVQSSAKSSMLPITPSLIISENN